MAFLKFQIACVTAQATAALTLVVIVCGYLWARCFSVDEEKYLDRKLIRVYTCAFAFSNIESASEEKDFNVDEPYNQI